MYSREEAIQLMKDGNKVTHRLFSDGEFIYMDSMGTVREENGYDFTEGFADKNDEPFQDGWKLYKED